MQDLLDASIRLNKVEISAKAVGFVDVLALLLPERLILVESLIVRVELEHLKNFGLDLEEPVLEAGHVRRRQSLLLLGFVLFKFGRRIVLLIIILVIVVSVADFLNV